MSVASISNALNASGLDGTTKTLIRKLLEAMRSSFLFGQATAIDIANLVDGAGASQDVTVTGAALGDFAIPSLGVDAQGLTVTANVKSANTVTVRVQNETGGAIDLASTTIRVIVFKAANFDALTLMGLRV